MNLDLFPPEQNSTPRPENAIIRQRSSKMFVETETIRIFLSGTDSRVPHVTRIGLSSLFVLRLLALFLGDRVVWKDDLSDLVCNSTEVGCQIECYNQLSPISPFTLCALQMIFLCNLSLVNLCYSRDSSRSQLGHLNLWAKGLIEGTFLYACSRLYSGFFRPSSFPCDLAPCGKIVTCYMLKSGQKDAFFALVASASLASLCICALTVCYFLEKKRYNKGEKLLLPL